MIRGRQNNLVAARSRYGLQDLIARSKLKRKPAAAQGRTGWPQR